MRSYILLLLCIGIIYRLLLTSNGNFIFNMDNGRDMVDVREMVVLQKSRLIGPTSAIDGFYNGPFWYYLLAIPFVLTGGDPYAAIVMEIIFWAVGGYFLLKLASEFGKLATLTAGFLWIASNFVVLTTSYAFNPNPVLLLTPLFIFLLKRYLETNKLFFAISSFALGGLFFNFEMNFGLFVPLIIFSTAFFYKKILLIHKNFWLGLISFIFFLIPQVLFDLRHGFLMTQAVINHLARSESSGFSLFPRFPEMMDKFFNVLAPTFFNQPLLTKTILVIFLLLLIKISRDKALKSNLTLIISLIYIFIPFVGFILIPTTVNPWHLGGVVATAILLTGFMVSQLQKINFSGKVLSYLIFLAIFYFTVLNMADYFKQKKPNMDPSLFANEIRAVDYVYQKAEGQNFKVYVYLPSVYDFPYQYLFWWYGNKKYGYIPGEYAYLPDKPPQYIPSKEKFNGRKDNFSGLVFLIKEPDRIKMRQAWQDDFEHLQFISKEMVGPIEVEVRREISQS